MANVLILGGTGYLGLTLSKALLSSGIHLVWGTARTPEKAKLPTQNEITPLKGGACDRGSWAWWGDGGVLKAATARSGGGNELESEVEAIEFSADITTFFTGTVHVDDVAAAFHTAIDHLDRLLGSWPVFELVTQTLGVQEILEAVKVSLGVKAPVKYTGTNGDAFLEALSLTSKVDASRARMVLG
ncbi:uncharacterized protein BDV17DRAFT_288756 [Aspergillus undulatus]|uniref:uncharacterized protein n=1 Tax=Aspergillus undulatus TaxID=1810928 RepID=UPI003CCDAA38